MTDEVYKATTELGQAISELSEQAEGLSVAFGKASDSSKGWNIISRLLSGSGLWKLQNRIRAAGNMIAMYNRHQMEGMQASLKGAEANMKLITTIDKLRKSRQLLMKGRTKGWTPEEMDTDIVRQFKVFAAQYERQGYAQNIAKKMAAEKVKRMYDNIIGEATSGLAKSAAKMLDSPSMEYLKKGFIRSQGGGIMMGAPGEDTKEPGFVGENMRIFFKRQKDNWGKLKRGQGTWNMIGDKLRGGAKFIGRFFQVGLTFFLKGMYYFFVISGAITLLVMILQKLKLRERFMEFEESFKGVQTIVGGVVEFLKGIFMMVKGAFSGDGGMFLRGIKKVILDGLLPLFLGGLMLGFQVIATLIKSILGAIFSVLGKIPIIGKYIPQFAKGGIAPGGMALVGERGPELVNLPAGARVHSNADSRRMVGNNIHVHVNGRVGASDAEIRDIANKVAREINLRMNRTGATAGRF